jgi:hypothetical protein
MNPLLHTLGCPGMSLASRADEPRSDLEAVAFWPGAGCPYGLPAGAARGRCADSRRPGDHGASRWNVKSVEPSVKRSPSSSFARFSRRPFTSTPFVESRSTIQYDVPSWRSSA